MFAVLASDRIVEATQAQVNGETMRNKVSFGCLISGCEFKAEDKNEYIKHHKEEHVKQVCF